MAARWWRGSTVGLVLAGATMVVLPTSCSRPKPPCPVADLTRAGLERGQQRAKVELGLPLRDNPGTGKSWFTISVWTGCRPQ